MIGDSLQFPGNRPDRLRPVGYPACGIQRFQNLAVCGGGRGGSVSGGGFHNMQSPFIGTAPEQVFDTPVLITQ